MEINADVLMRFLHVLAGIVWIGHLYFFNLTNLPAFSFKIAGGDPAVKGGPALMLRAFFWFRWGAMATLIFGLGLYFSKAANLVGDGMLYENHLAYLTDFSASGGGVIMLGMLLGIIMWFNVWFIIWPNQRIVLNNNIKIAKGVTDDEKKAMEADNAPRVKNAKLASRTNFWLSIPMLLFMVSSAHLPQLFA